MTAVQSPIGLLCFPVLFKPRAVVAGGEPRYSTVLLFDAETIKQPAYLALRKAVLDAGNAEWGEAKMKDVNFVKGLRLPFRDAGEMKEYAGFEAGKVFIRPWSKNPPGVVDANLQEITVPEDVWPGQRARVHIQPFTYDTSGNRGINFGLHHVQITRRDMPRLDGRKAAHEVFDNIDDGETETADADMPF